MLAGAVLVTLGVLSFTMIGTDQIVAWAVAASRCRGLIPAAQAVLGARIDRLSPERSDSCRVPP